MTKNAKIIGGIIVLILIVSIVINSNKKDSGPIKIGFIGPLTGEISSLGVAGQAATQIAVEEINSAGGINGRKIELISEDGKCSAKDGLTAAQKLISIDKVVAIVGGLCSGETTGFIKIASDAKIPTISYGASAPALSNSGKYFFRTYPSDANQGKVAAEYVLNTLKAKKVAIIYHISDWGSGIESVFVSRFKELGGQILIEEGAAPTVRDYKTELTKIKSTNPDYIYAPLYPDGGLVAVKQALDLGISTKIMGADSFGDTKFIKEVDPHANITYVEVYNNPTDAFKTKLLAKTGGDQVPTGAPQAYDAMKVLSLAISSVGINGDLLQAAIRKVTLNGESGTVTFDKNGDVTSTKYWINKIVNGKTEKIQ